VGTGLCDMLFHYVGHKIIIGRLFLSFSPVTFVSECTFRDFKTEFIIEVQFQDKQLTKLFICVCVCLCVCVCGGGGGGG
jgi:hypothetical protein